ncbi:MAG: hypothetical protein QXM53_02580 [Thermofilaceae archaeon]
MAVVLGRIKKKGLTLAFDYESKVFLVKDYAGKTHLVGTVEEVINLLLEKEASKKSTLRSNGDGTINQTDEKSNNFLSISISNEERRLLLSRLYKTDPKLYKNGQVVKFSHKGLRKMIDSYFKNFISKEEKDKVELFVLQRLYEDFFIKKVIPSTETLRGILASLKRKVLETNRAYSPSLEQEAPCFNNCFKKLSKI